MDLLEPLPDDVENELQNEKILVCIKGAFKEWLICTDKKVCIFKKGFMSGHLLGKNSFQLPYRNISSVQVNKHVLSGYFEISSGGIQNTNKSYWSSDIDRSPQKAPNCISLTEHFDKFREACVFINNKIQEISNPKVQVVTQEPVNDIPTQIRKLADLKESGILSESEFQQKKAELLARM